MTLNTQKEIKKNISMSNAESSELPGYLRIHNIPSLHADNLKGPRPQKKYNPEFNYGISYEAPSNFELPHTIVNDKTYKNPFLPYGEKSRARSSKNVLEKLPKRKNLSDLHDFELVHDAQSMDNYVLKTKLPALKSYNCVMNDIKTYNQPDLYTGERSIFLENYNKILSESKDMFHKKKGLFTDFAERNEASFRLKRKSQSDFNISNTNKTMSSSDINKTLSQGSKENLQMKSVDNVIYADNMEMSVQTFSDDKTKSSVELSKFVSPRMKPYNKIMENTSKTSSNPKTVISILNSSNFSRDRAHDHLSRRNLPSWKSNVEAFKKSINEELPIDVDKYGLQDTNYSNLFNNHIIKSKMLHSLSKKTTPYNNEQKPTLYSEQKVDFSEFERNLRFYRQKRKRADSEKKMKFVLPSISSFNSPERISDNLTFNNSDLLSSIDNKL